MRTARPKPPGRSLEPASNAGPRGMIVVRRSARRKAGEGGNRIRLTAALRQNFFSIYLRRQNSRASFRRASEAASGLVGLSLVLRLAIESLAGSFVCRPAGARRRRPTSPRRPRQEQGRQGGGGRGAAAAAAAASRSARAGVPAGHDDGAAASARRRSFPRPSIVDYRPRSTLVTAEHLVPKAKFPAVDFHGHAAGALITPKALGDASSRTLDSINVGVFVQRRQHVGRRLQTGARRDRKQPAQGSRPRLHRAQLQGVGPGLGREGRRAAGGGREGRRRRRRRDQQELRPDARAKPTARGCRWTTRSSIRSGSRCARLNIPVFIHTAEPQEFFQPLDMHNERWLELALFRRPPELPAGAGQRSRS